MAIIVVSPDLVRVSCRTPHRMTLVNALCRRGKSVGNSDLAQIEPSVRAAAHECILVPDGGTP